MAALPNHTIIDLFLSRPVKHHSSFIFSSAFHIPFHYQNAMKMKYEEPFYPNHYTIMSFPPFSHELDRSYVLLFTIVFVMSK